jgi:dTDP-4-dehydrorhamnose reductase
MARLYLTGCDGLLGSAVREALRTNEATADWEVLGVSIHDFDIADRAATLASIEQFKPDIVLHLAALAIVDDCETDPARAIRVNVSGVRNVVEACRRTGARLLWISSDYVFDGAGEPEGGFGEGDLPNPLSVYGTTKAAGERLVSMVDDHLIIRTSWLFGGADEKVDDVLALLRQALAGRAPRLICDQFSRPTYTHDLAEALVFLMTRDVAGTIHVANEGSASWFEVGTYALDLIDPSRTRTAEPVAVPMAEKGFIGARPVDSTLRTERLADLGLTLPHWRDGVRRFCGSLGLLEEVAA